MSKLWFFDRSWFFTKIMKPVLAFLRKNGHRVYTYLDDFYGAARSSQGGSTSKADTLQIGTEFQELFGRLGLQLHHDKCNFAGRRQLEILGIVVDTERALFLLRPRKLAKVERQARRLLQYATSHKRL